VGSKENPDRTRKYESKTLAGHIGLPSDIADAVSFLVSEKARYIYAAIIPVNGGGASSR
jgi:NAD(P)-dependent dehydrogenase (short-subunit alcohol dehydrogenase family)